MTEKYLVSFCCPLCGEPLPGGSECSDTNRPADAPAAEIACLRRQLANLHSLLRSVTSRLEKVAEILRATDTCEPVSVADHMTMTAYVNAVLQALS